jgi:predicted amidophosphoribosyltransferase
MLMIDYLTALGDLFMPRACLACGCRLGMRERHLCLSCAADVPYTRFWLQSHNPLADRFNAVLERHRGTEPMDYAYAVALMYYKGAYRAIPRALKYHGDLAAGRHFGALLGRRLAAAPHFADIDLVIPVPLHWTRRRSRGYNQAALLAQSLVDAFRSAKHPLTAGHDASVPSIPIEPVTPGLTSSISHSLPDGRSESAMTKSITLDQTPPVPHIPTDGQLESAVTKSITLDQTPPVPHIPTDGRSESAVTKSVPLVSTPFVTPGLTGSLPLCRTDLLVRARRTRTQTRLSVEQKARNVASAFRVPERFPLWKRLISQWRRLFSIGLSWLFKRRPIGVGHDEARSEPIWRHSRLQSFRHSWPDPESPATVLASARHILLVDDTYTTGATLYACYAALRPYTSARISVATLAAVEGTPSGGP